VELHRIHLPSCSEPFEPGDVTYLSSREGAELVAAKAVAGGAAGSVAPRRVMVQVETGDEREGVPIDRLPALAAEISGDQRLRLAGISTNFACFKGRPEGIRRSVELITDAAAALRRAGLPVDRVSGGNSSVLWLLAEGRPLPAGVTELRCGEALLLGQDALYYRPLPGCRTDACVLRAEVIEEYTRPAPRGPARRLVLGVGRQDVGTGAVRFLEPGLSEVGRSADYLVVEAEAAGPSAPVGMMIDMIPSYEALVAAWTSPYVELKFQGL
jgi:predicted amino acid racemase